MDYMVRLSTPPMLVRACIYEEHVWADCRSRQIVRATNVPSHDSLTVRKTPMHPTESVREQITKIITYTQLGTTK